MRRIARLPFLALVLVFVPCAASPQGNPLGPAFRVNTYTAKVQDRPAVASDSSGNFVVVWRDELEGSIRGVFGQRYASTGAPLGPEFRVNTYTTGRQDEPAVASDSSGNFVVIWSSGGQYGFVGVFGQRYASSGKPLGPEFRINTYTTSSQSEPAVASDSSGNFVVVWESRYPDLSDYGVFAQRYANTGEPLGPEFRVNTYTTKSQSDPAVASDSSGKLVIIWRSYQDGSGDGVFAQRYASTGAPLGPEFRVNTWTSSDQVGAVVASDSSGNFVVVWDSRFHYNQSAEVFGQRYASTGEPLGSEFRVNTYTTGHQQREAVASDSSGNFIVVWDSPQDSGGPGIHGIFGQRYGRIVPVELTHFEVE